MGEDQGTGDDDAAADAEADGASTGDAGANDASLPADVPVSAILAGLALKLAFWLGLAALVGYRATLRNRGFFKWSILALVFSPALIYLILRLMGPAEEGV